VDDFAPQWDLIQGPAGQPATQSVYRLSYPVPQDYQIRRQNDIICPHHPTGQARFMNFTIQSIIRTWEVFCSKQQDVVLVHVMKVYRESRSKVPPIINFGSRQMLVVNFTLRPFHPLVPTEQQAGVTPYSV
jgi:hypothetical protein